MRDETLDIGRLIAYLKEKRSLLFVVTALILGVLLMLLGRSEGASEENLEAVSLGNNGTAELEERVEALCEKIVGVGDASVLITLETLGENVYAKDVQLTKEGESQSERVEYVKVSQGLVQTGELPPRVKGIAIVCEGGDNAGIQLKLTDMMCALFGLQTNCVKIVGSK